MMNLPSPEFQSPPLAVARQRSHGALLSVFLWFGILGNAVALLVASVTATSLSQTSADDILTTADADALVLAKKVLFLGVLTAVLRIVCLAGVWAWKRWAVYGYAALGTFGVLLAFKDGAISGLFNLFVFVLVLSSIASRWSQFE